jgi:hypothetical protein
LDAVERRGDLLGDVIDGGVEEIEHQSELRFVEIERIGLHSVLQWMHMRESDSRPRLAGGLCPTGAPSLRLAIAFDQSQQIL